MTLERCPSPAELEAARDGHGVAAGDGERDRSVLQHAASCDACATVLAGLAELGELARGLRMDPFGGRQQEEAEVGLLLALGERGGHPEPARHGWPPRPWVRPWLARGMAVAAAVVLAFVAGVVSAPRLRSAPRAAGSSEPTAGPAALTRLSLEARPGAVYELGGSQAAPALRLQAGTVAVEVGGLVADGRLRVLTADAEVQARTGRFEISADRERLAQVRVRNGEVEVHRQGRVQRLREEQSLDVRLELTRSSPVFAGAAVQAPEPPPGPSETPAAPPPEPPPGPSETRPETPREPSDRARRESARRAGAAVAAPPAATPAAPAAPPTPFRNALALFSQRQYLRAAVEFGAEADRSDSPLREDARFWSAVAWARAGNRALAVSVFRSFLQEHPRSRRLAEAHTALGWQLLERGEAAAARRHFEVGVGAAAPEVKRSARAGLEATERAARGARP